MLGNYLGWRPWETGHPRQGINWCICHALLIREIQLVGHFGFRAHHTLFLGILQALIYWMTRRKSEFEWDPKQKRALRDLQRAVASNCTIWVGLMHKLLWRLLLSGHTDWSLLQKCLTLFFPPQAAAVGILDSKFPDVEKRYDPFERQLLAFYWALVHTAPTAQGFKIILRSIIPLCLGQCQIHSHKEGVAQKTSV